MLSSPTLFIQSSIFTVGFKTYTERLTSFISSSPVRAQNGHRPNSIVSTESGSMVIGQELLREYRDRPSGCVSEGHSPFRFLTFSPIDLPKDG